ncbi:hypothetical protein N7505_001430 [Penicillium chrysogenum]|uniref:Uncharacterized protein n=1 Tax=Penicillium chrysogenum TaxID=5076 RepID=A0ABQ8WWW5_PENCH|nr:hypothetical protein N7505_001430 [Penicillium chrysogenum]
MVGRCWHCGHKWQLVLDKAASQMRWCRHQYKGHLFLQDGSVTLNCRDNHGDTLLAFAAEQGNETVVVSLLCREDVQPDSRNDALATPLAMAAERGHERVVLLLLNHADIEADSTDKEGCTPLARAAAMGLERIVRFSLIALE